MVQTGMTTPYTAFAQQNGGPGAGDTTSLKPDMKAVEGGPPGGGGGGGSPNGVTQQALQALQSAQHANGVVDQQQNATVRIAIYDAFAIVESALVQDSISQPYTWLDKPKISIFRLDFAKRISLNNVI